MQIALLESSLLNLENLIKVARWEWLLLSTPAHREHMLSRMRFHLSLLNSLAWNLRLRFSRRDGFGRGTDLQAAVSS